MRRIASVGSLEQNGYSRCWGGGVRCLKLNYDSSIMGANGVVGFRVDRSVDETLTTPCDLNLGIYSVTCYDRI